MLGHMKLKGKMLILLLVPLVLILSLIITISYNSSKNALEQEIQYKLASLGEQYTGNIYLQLAPIESMIDNVANISQIDQKPAEILQPILADWAKAHSELSSVYIAWKDGRFIDSGGFVPPAGYVVSNMSWYQEVTQGDGLVYTKVYLAEDSNEYVVTFGRKLTINGEIAGTVCADVKLKRIQEMVKEIKTGTSGYAFLLDRDGNYLAHPELSIDDNVFTINNGALQKFGEQVLSGKPQMLIQSFNGVDKYIASVPVGKTGWVFVLSIPVKEALASIHSLMVQVLGISLVGLLILGVLIYYVAMSVVRPVRVLDTMVSQVAKNDLSADYSCLLERTSKDEVTSLMHNFYQMIESLRTVVQKVADSSQQVAAASEELTANAQQSAQAANQVATAIMQVTQGTENQAAVVNEASVVIEKMSSDINGIAATGNQVVSLVGQTVAATDLGQKSVEQAVVQIDEVGKGSAEVEKVVTELVKGSKEINEIVGLISSIAGQTNLLALNAAIEAARAGEHGRGFSVVAEEVRKLAEQSNQAAQNIGQVIYQNEENMEKALSSIRQGSEGIQRGVEVVHQAGMAFENIAALVADVNVQVKQISQAIQQIDIGSDKIVDAVQAIDKESKNNAEETQSVSAATQEQSATMEEIASASENLAQLAEELQDAVNVFKV